MLRPVRALWVFALLLGVWPGIALADPRIALVIGNSNYGGDIGNLANPANDAKLIAKTLRGIGFDVVEVEDADQNAMKRAIVDFGNKLSDAGSDATGLFYYAGHGVQVQGENFLVPVKATIHRESDVDVEAVSADLVLRQMDFAGSAVNIVILDACRNSPLTRGFRSGVTGLAEITRKPRGSFMAYSTAPGDVAADGSGANSPYAEALAATIVEPGQGIEEVFREVRAKVLAATDNKQTTWDSSSLTAPFSFVAGAPAQAAAPSTAAPSDAADPMQIELAFWGSVKDTPSLEGYQAYLNKYPDGDFAALAKIGIANLKAAALNSQARAVVPASQTPSAAPPVAQASTQHATQPQAAKSEGQDAAKTATQPAPPPEDSASSASPTPSRSANFGKCKPNSGAFPPDRETACRSALQSDALEPDARGNVFNWLGLALYDQRRYDQALASFQSAIEIKPAFPAPYYNIGLVNRDREDFAAARASFDKAASLDSKNPTPVLERGLATVYLGDMDAGIADMRSAIALKSTDYHYFTKLMRAQLANGNLPAAVDALGRAVQIDPTMWDGAGVLVDYLSDSREKLNAMLAQGVEREPDFPFWDFWKGMLQKKAGDGAGAKAMFAAGRKQIKDAPWLAALFEYAGGGSISPRELRAQARSDNPRFQAEHLTVVNYFIGELAMIGGNRDAARDAWQRAVDGHVYYLAEYGAAKVRLTQVAGQ